MRHLALLGLLLAACGSPCRSACERLTGTGCAGAPPNARIHVDSLERCADDCESNSGSLCFDPSNADTNQSVLDCVSGITCDSEAGHDSALRACMRACPGRT